MPAPEVAADLSIYELFKNAHIIVKLVMIGLLLASIWSWAIIIEKFFVYARAKRETEEFDAFFWSGKTLDDIYQVITERPSNNTSAVAVFMAAMKEWRKSTEHNPGERAAKPLPGVQLRVEKALDVAISRDVERLESRLTFLATVGSTAPFIGLFGTVWGIMTSFQAIAVSKNTSLAVVAPGIAEALFATALGLLAAIPAVIFYNKFNSEVARHAARLEGFADEFSALLSRHIDVRA